MRCFRSTGLRPENRPYTNMSQQRLSRGYVGQPAPYLKISFQVLQLKGEKHKQTDRCRPCVISGANRLSASQACTGTFRMATAGTVAMLYCPAHWGFCVLVQHTPENATTIGTSHSTCRKYQGQLLLEIAREHLAQPLQCISIGTGDQSCAEVRMGKQHETRREHKKAALHTLKQKRFLKHMKRLWRLYGV